jgi:Papain-like cysteine protease AvrRpt2
MSSRILERPMIVVQKEAWMCWAAVLEAWLKVTKGMRGEWDQETLAQNSDYLKDLSSAGAPTHSSDPNLFLKLLNDPILNIRMQISQSNTAQAVDYYYRLIRDRGYLFVVYTLPGGRACHANLVYGADTDYDFLNVMNPSPGAGLQTRRPTELTGPLAVGYREYSMLP